MHHHTTIRSAALALLLTTPTIAGDPSFEFLELRVQATLEADDGTLIPYAFSATFISNVEPLGSEFGTSFYMPSSAAQVLNTTTNASPTPFTTNDITTGETNASTTMTYVAEHDTIYLTTFGYPDPLTWLDMMIVHPQGDWSVDMDSIPDEASDYQPDPNNPDSRITISIGENYVASSWNHTEGFTGDGTFSIQIAPTTNPELEPCIADLNQDGDLDFADITTLIHLFQTNCR
jgi:hypothetical protein